jgi:RES domain-containing protein
MELVEHEEYERLARNLTRGRQVLRAWKGTCYRFASPRYSEPTELLSGQGALKYGSRWIPPGVAATVHGSTTPRLAFAESLARYQRANVPEWQAMPLVVCAVLVEVSSLLDLTDGKTRRSLRVSLGRLLAVDWGGENRAGREAIGQALGRAAFDARGVEGLLVPSSTGEPGANLVLFPERLRLGSRLEVRQGSA